MLMAINHSAGSECRKLMGFHGHVVLYKLLAKKKINHIGTVRYEHKNIES